MKTSYVRCYFEYSILSYFCARQEFQRILFIGVSRHTQHYASFFQGKESFRTIDSDPEKVLFSQDHIHIVDLIERLDTHIQPESLDLVICNGVYGWGLNDEKALIQSLIQVHRSLRRGGVLVFGWNQILERDPLQIESKNYFHTFKPYAINGQHRIELPRNPQRLVFTFYQK